jgi:hypothetical protein
LWLRYVLPAVIVIPLLALWAAAVTDVFQRADGEFPQHWRAGDQRVIWAFLLLVTNAVGAAFYYYLVMRPFPRRRR